MLQTVPGIQLDYLRTPTSFTFFNVQGALNNTVLVLVDGVRWNDFSGNVADPGKIPVQHVERIEIVKGAASAAWGPALGGVVNIVTKSPDPDRPVGGLLSGSIGEKATTDVRAELSGTAGRFGYYVTGGNIGSDGLRPNNGTDLDHFHGKVAFRGADGSKVAAAFSFLDVRQGQDEGLLFGWPVHDDLEVRQKVGWVKYSRPLADRLSVELDAFALGVEKESKYNDVIDNAIVPFSHFRVPESSIGGSARLSWGDGGRGLVAGAEFGHDESRSAQIVPSYEPYFDRSWDRWAAYCNGAFTVGPVTVLPGVRFDHTGLSRNYTSATLGATWQVTDRTLLRAYGARGYGLPFPDTAQHGLMTIHTVQGGVESEAVPYLWLKGTAFYNRLRDIESVGVVELTNQDRAGYELEGRTVPWRGLSLSAAYTFTRVEDADSGARLKTNGGQTVPPHVLKAALRYDEPSLGLKGTVTGSWVDWNADPGYPSSSRGAVWDAHLAWKVRPQDDLSPELFASGRNLFSNVQTTHFDLYDNAPRWFEGGARVRF